MRQRLVTFNDPHPRRIDRDLAAEIGLEESIVFLQLEHLISISKHEYDGRLWTHQSLAELRRDQFPWWSTSTISRILKRLEEHNLIVTGNYNKLGFDRTVWYALNEEGINKLTSVRLVTAQDSILQSDTSILQDETPILQSDVMDSVNLQNASSQIETTIPESTTEITQRDDAHRQQRKATKAQLTQSSATYEALFNLGLTRAQCVMVLQKIPAMTPVDVTAWNTWLSVCTAPNPIATMIRHMMDGRRIPPPLPAAPPTRGVLDPSKHPAAIAEHQRRTANMTKASYEA